MPGIEGGKKHTVYRSVRRIFKGIMNEREREMLTRVPEQIDHRERVWTAG